MATKNAKASNTATNGAVVGYEADLWRVAYATLERLFLKLLSDKRSGF